MSAELIVNLINGLYLLLMGVVCVAGSAAMLKLASTFFQPRPTRRSLDANFSVEDA
jgi:hypothetical protein